MNKAKIAITLDQETVKQLDHFLSHDVFNQRSGTVIAIWMHTAIESHRSPPLYRIKVCLAYRDYFGE